MDELPDEYLSEILQLAKKIAKANGLSDYNILQVCLRRAILFVYQLLMVFEKNNGALAFQHIFHVHFHVIPKPNEAEGLKLSLDSWPHRERTNEELAATLGEMQSKL
jgi:post-GPI attachment to proteins factor 3